MGLIKLKCTTVADDLPHKSRAVELRELPFFIEVDAGGASGTFTDKDGKVVTVVNGIIQSIVAPT